VNLLQLVALFFVGLGLLLGAALSAVFVLLGCS
jgi:hypothetical protein